MAGEKNSVQSTNDRRERNIIHQLLEEYYIQITEDIQDELKDFLSRTIKKMIKVEIESYFKNSHRLKNK